MGLSLMGVLGWCFFGLIVGLIAKFLIPGHQHLGIFVTIVLGIAGSFAGGFLSSLVFGHADDLVNPSGWIMSVIGAMLLLFAYGKIAKA